MRSVSVLDHREFIGRSRFLMRTSLMSNLTESMGIFGETVFRHLHSSLCTVQSLFWIIRKTTVLNYILYNWLSYV